MCFQVCYNELARGWAYSMFSLICTYFRVLTFAQLYRFYVICACTLGRRSIALLFVIPCSTALVGMSIPP